MDKTDATGLAEHYPYKEGHTKSHGHMAKHDIKMVENVILPQGEEKYLKRIWPSTIVKATK